ncbi:hypothetical protein ACFL59_10695 [Planctomycetota bacterium]
MRISRIRQHSPSMVVVALMVMAVAAGVGFAGCGDTRTAERDDADSPRATVLSLQRAIASGEWEAAASHFTAECLGLRKGEPASKSYWRRKVSTLPLSKGVWWPLGPQDTVLGEKPTQKGVTPSGVQVFLRHVDRCEKDARPRCLILNRVAGEWRVVSSRN